MARQGLKRNVRTRQRDDARQRESLERRWSPDAEHMSTLGHLVVQESRLREPFHRWLPYRQGFSPELVRRVLRDGELANGPVLDPFSGGGTTLIEAARAGHPALAMEALPSLAFLANARFLTPEEPVEFSPDCTTLDDAWAAARSDAGRAAVLCAAARTVSGDGSPLKQPQSDRALLDACVEMINADLRTPLAATGSCLCGDARTLPFPDASVGGILTSPPYLSRYDYTRVTRPLERLFSGDNADAQKRAQIRAHHRARAQTWTDDVHPALAESCERLVEEGRAKEAGIVRSYIEDMNRVMAECARVLMPGAPMVVVVASVVFGSVYIPADCLLIEQCVRHGLQLEENLLVRTFSDHGKALGALKSVSPRETIFTVRKLA